MINDALKVINKKMPDVIPEKWTNYKRGILFIAYPKNCKDKKEVLDPYYYVEGEYCLNFSPVMDMEGYIKASESFKDIR